MTTVKEFEEQKQGIAIKLNDALDAMLELKPNLASNIVADQIKAIHKLQPPHPTCSICEYWVDENLKINDTDVYPHKTCDNLKMWDSLKLGLIKMLN